MAKLLEIDQLEVGFRTEDGLVRAVDRVSFDVEAGETVAVVGESGSGKSVTARAVLGLVPQPPGVIAGGAIRFKGEDLLTLDPQRLRDLRGARISMVFQEPMTALNPLLSIGTQLTEGMRAHLGYDRTRAERRAAELLDMVGIAEPEQRLKPYPHQFSGGMRQRVVIAMALACEPELILADEPTTALDVTIQAQILELMQDLTRRLGVALVLITHNLGVVARYARRVNVMYAGRIVEQGPTDALFERPRHPYTLGLLGSVPRLDRARTATLEAIDGQPLDPAALPEGCAFRPHCGFASARCQAVPPLVEVEPGDASAGLHRDAPARDRARGGVSGGVRAAYARAGGR
jgi:oligopeptide/dipeptide ABC transporter ATP-binding protein